MNAVELVLPDGRKSGVWMCQTCKHLTHEQVWAERCCVCSDCGKSKDWSTSNLDCDDCRKATYIKRDREKMERAEKLDDWDGWVWSNCDHYYPSLDDYLDHLECEGIEPDDYPDFVYIAEEQRLPEINMEHILENICEGWDYESFDPEKDINGVEELSKAIDAFNAANATTVSYYAFEKRAVRVPRPPEEQ